MSIFSVFFKKPRKSVPKALSDIVNMFNHLNLDEPSEAFNNACDVTTTPLEPVHTEANYKAERLAITMEDFVAFSLLFSDLDRLRIEVYRAWEGYCQDLLDLVSASITTNTAVELARSLEEDGNEMFDKHGGSEKMLAMYYHALRHTHRTTESYRERPNDELNFKVYDAADAIFLPAYLTLSSFCNVVQPGFMPELKPGHFGYYDPSSDRSQKTNREKFKEDKVLLTEILPEFIVL